MRTKCIILGEALRIRVKKFKQNLPKNYSKSTKIANTACKFSNFFRGSMPLDPPRAFFVSQSASNLFFPKKVRLKFMWKLCPPLPPFQNFSLRHCSWGKLANSNLIFCCSAVICPKVSFKIEENFLVTSYLSSKSFVHEVTRKSNSFCDFVRLCHEVAKVSTLVVMVSIKKRNK